MPKTEVYSWRVSPALKDRLEEAARRERKTVAAFLDELVQLHLGMTERASLEDASRQRELQAAAMKFAGRLSGDDPARAANTRARVRSRLASRHHAGR